MSAGREPFRRIALVASLVAAAFVALPFATSASSHREAPGITKKPKVDGTDFYMFRSYEAGREGFVTLVADYLPLQDPYGGPNYFMLDPDARYEIKVDNDGDAREDITFRFRFRNQSRNIALPIGDPVNPLRVPVPLINVGPITAGDNSALNVVESYTVEIVRGDDKHFLRNAATGEARFEKPVDNIGNKSLPDYEAYAAAAHLQRPHPGLPGRPAVRRPAQGPVRRQPGRGLRPRERHEPAGPGRRRGRRPRGQERDLADPRGADRLPHQQAHARDRRVDHGQPAARRAEHRRRLGPGVAARRAARERGRDRPQGQGPLQRERAEVRRAVRELRHQPDAARHARDPVRRRRREGAHALPARRPRGGVPDRRRGPERERLGGGDAPAQHQHRAQGGRRAEQPRRDRRRRRRLPERPPSGRRRRRHRAARGDGQAAARLANAPSGQLPFTDGALVDASHFSSTFPYLRTPLPGSPNGTP